MSCVLHDNNFKITSEAELQYKCCQLQQEMDLLDTDIIDQNIVDSLDIKFQDILTNLEQIAHKTLKFKQITIGKQGRFLPKKNAIIRKKLINTRQTLVNNLINGGNKIDSKLRKELQTQLKETRAELKNIDDKQQQDDINIAVQKFRQLQYTDPKKVHKKLFKNNERFNLDCIQEPLTGELHTDNNKTNELIQQYFTELLCPLTTDDIDNIPAPWENDVTVPFKLKLPLIHNDEVKQLMYDPIVFQDCIMSLSNNKAPGPDGLLNELLKFAPYCVKCIIHDFFKLIYTCTFTPTAWKTSETVLLYKKNDPTLIKKLQANCFS